VSAPMSWATFAGPPSWVINSASEFDVFIPTLNTMFSFPSNTTFNNTLFSSGKLKRMSKSNAPVHPSLERLLLVAAEVAKTRGPAAVAAALNESEQTVTNWKRRGVSKAGALKAQDVYGCSPNWILHETLPKFAGSKTTSSTSPVLFPSNKVQQAQASYDLWPFQSITRADYFNVLTDEDRALVENTALGLFKARGASPKQIEPAKYKHAS
jgi:hypothetical protein